MAQKPALEEMEDKNNQCFPSLTKGQSNAH